MKKIEIITKVLFDKNFEIGFNQYEYIKDAYNEALDQMKADKAIIKYRGEIIDKQIDDIYKKSKKIEKLEHDNKIMNEIIRRLRHEKSQLAKQNEEFAKDLKEKEVYLEIKDEFLDNLNELYEDVIFDAAELELKNEELSNKLRKLKRK